METLPSINNSSRIPDFEGGFGGGGGSGNGGHLSRILILFSLLLIFSIIFIVLFVTQMKHQQQEDLSLNGLEILKHDLFTPPTLLA